MLHNRIGRGGLDYCLFQLPNSKLSFRGPAPDFGGRYVAVLGSCETFGKFVPTPYPALLSQSLETQCVNFSAHNAGPDFFLGDAALVHHCNQAVLNIVSVTGALNMSNRFFQVHPRHNDRYVGHSKPLTTLFRNLDSGDIHFTKHLMRELLAQDPFKFTIVVEELKQAWVARMVSLLKNIEGPKILLWVSDHVPHDVAIPGDDPGLTRAPLFVDQVMMDKISPYADQVAECVFNRHSMKKSRREMVYTEDETDAAAVLPGPQIHQKIAVALEKIVSPYL